MDPPISAFGACLTVLPSNHSGVVQPQATLPNKHTLAFTTVLTKWLCVCCPYLFTLVYKVLPYMCLIVSYIQSNAYMSLIHKKHI